MTCRLTGTLAWIERDGRLVVLRVRDTDRGGRAFRGRTVTVDVSEARVSVPDCDADGVCSAADLLPGERVLVRVALERARAELPGVVVARQVIALDHGF